MEKNNKTIITIITIIVVLIVLGAFLKILENRGENTNTDSNSESKTNTEETDSYDKSKVAFTGIQDISGDGYTGTYSVDVVFEDDGCTTKYYLKKVMNYDQKLEDEKVIEILKDIDSLTLARNESEYNVKGTTNLGFTSFGFDTVVTINGNTITVTGYKSDSNNGSELTEEDKENVKKSIEKQGFTIN